MRRITSPWATSNGCFEMRKAASDRRLFLFRAQKLDALVVGAPVVDVLLDGFGFETLGEGLADESGELVIGGEAQRDELRSGEFGDVLVIFGG